MVMHKSTLTIPETITSFVGGAFVKAEGNAIDVVDPATGTVLSQLFEADREEVGKAVLAARQAFDQTDWPRLQIEERQKILMALHDIIMENLDELAALETLNTGIPLAQTRGLHVPRAAHNFRFFSETINQLGGDVFDQEPDVLSTVTHEPLGVCVLIGPWNMPLGLTAMKIAGALAFGNTCVVKPSEITPLTVSRFVELAQNTLPKGVLNLVNGRGHVTGTALTSHDGIDMVSFTGGTTTGAAILTSLAPGIKRPAMELGGKSASIIFDDADFDYALDGAMLGSFMNNGQMCLAGSRIFVQRGIADRFIAAFTERTKNLRIGDPSDPATEIGPMINQDQCARMLHYAQSGADQSATLLAGGKMASGHGSDLFVEPTVMLAPDNDLAICQEEIFGPFATIQIFDDEDEVIAKANASEFGLVGYVWTEGLTRALRVAAALRTGTVLINTPIVRDLRTGFGGYKMSGLGREGAKGSRAMFTEEKATIIAQRRRNFPRMGLGTPT
jgi:acyl-CoA reductase-like NAD-dependent aldehyde dehydrogenase